MDYGEATLDLDDNSNKDTQGGPYPIVPIAGNESWRHRENLFYDSNREPLIPYLLSTSGPKIAIGDANGDGLEDFYAGGASGQSGALFLQKRDGSFTLRASEAFDADLECEDTGALFFDADGDGDDDLYVASGGNEYYQKDPRLIDRLYFNDGKGNFIRRSEALPTLVQSVFLHYLGRCGCRWGSGPVHRSPFDSG